MKKAPKTRGLWSGICFSPLPKGGPSYFFFFGAAFFFEAAFLVALFID
jgi:hypothetical protein